MSSMKQQMINRNVSLKKQDNYIETILDKLAIIGDEELSSLVKQLIHERNYLTEMINIDVLTGLSNRRVLNRINDANGVIMIDIDDFKRINDKYGHEVGDYVIKKVAEILMGNVGISDYACRFGGDEFIIVFSDSSEDIIKEQTMKIADEITHKVRVHADTITVSIGVVINKSDLEFDELLRMADMALYESKMNGKKQINEFAGWEDKENRKIKKLSLR